MERKNFVTYYPSFANIHLMKDTGMIPFILQRDFNYNSYIVSINNGPYTDLLTQFKGLHMFFLENKPLPTLYLSIEKIVIGIQKKLTSFFLKTLHFVPFSITKYRDFTPFLLIFNNWKKIIKIFRKTDVLQFYHLKEETIFLSLIYRLVNPKGLIYVKLDLDPSIIEKFQTNPKIFNFIKGISWFLKKINFNLISVENQELLDFLSQYSPLLIPYKKNMFYVPNGLDLKTFPSRIAEFKNRENIILHIARIGSYQKASEVIIKSFLSLAPEFPNWKLYLIGNVDKEYKNDFKKEVLKNPLFNSQIFYVKFIESRKEFLDLYNRAKILALPSRYEGFALVSLEAGAMGCVLIGSDIRSNRVVTDNGNLGYLSKIDDIPAFTQKMKYMITHPDELNEKSKKISQFIRSNFDWQMICNNLIKRIL